MTIQDSPQADRIRVMLIDDHPLVLEGLEALIDRQPDMQVCGQAGSLDEALLGLKKVQPDIAIVDLSLGDDSGLELLKEIKHRHPSVQTLVLSMLEEALYAERALKAGARGYVMKSENPLRLVQGIREVIQGRLFFDPSVSERILLNLADGTAPDSPLSLLTDRELEVFQLLGAGLSSQEIAARLEICVKTVEVHRLNMKNKLGVRHSTELVKKAVESRGFPAAPL